MSHLSSLDFYRLYRLMPIIWPCFKLKLHTRPGNRGKTNVVYIPPLTLLMNLVFVFILLSAHAVRADGEILALEVNSNQKFRWSRVWSQVLLNVIILAVWFKCHAANTCVCTLL